MLQKNISIWIIILILAIIVIGVVVYTPSAIQPTTSNEIKIGAILPLTGDAAKYGEDAKNGIDLAASELNAAGGINGNKIQVIYEDDQATPSQSVAAIQKLIAVDKVPVIIGAMTSSSTLAIAPIAENSKVVLLSPASSAPNITESGDYIFRNELSDSYGAKIQANMTWNDLKIKRVAILYLNNDFGVNAKEIFSNNFESFGGNITDVEAFKQGDTDFRTQLIKIKDSNPDAILMLGYKEMIPILQQTKELGIKTQILSNPMFEDPEILQKTGNLSEGVIYSYYGGFDPESQQKQIQDFVLSYRQKYGQEPGYYSALSYDAMKIVGIALEKGGSNSDGIKDALYSVQNYSGVTGLTSFDKNGDVIKPVILKTVRNGTFVEWK